MVNLRTLVLNASYTPISLFPVHAIPVEDAVTRCFNGTCHIVAEHDRKILTQSLNMNWPSVIARNDNLRIKNSVKLRRESLYYRDHGICVYCEKQMTISEVTYDHVHPQARGGVHSWENVVSACTTCNMAKGSSLPVGIWKPKIKPYEPSYYQLLAQRKRFPIVVPSETWVPYLGNWEADVIIAC